MPSCLLQAMYSDTVLVTYSESVYCVVSLVSSPMPVFAWEVSPMVSFGIGRHRVMCSMLATPKFVVTIGSSPAHLVVRNVD